MSLLKALIQGLLRGFHFQQYGDASVFFQRDTGAKEHLFVFGEVIHAKITFAQKTDCTPLQFTFITAFQTMIDLQKVFFKSDRVKTRIHFQIVIGNLNTRRNFKAPHRSFA